MTEEDIVRANLAQITVVSDRYRSVLGREDAQMEALYAFTVAMRTYRKAYASFASHMESVLQVHLDSACRRTYRRRRVESPLSIDQPIQCGTAPIRSFLSSGSALEDFCMLRLFIAGLSPALRAVLSLRLSGYAPEEISRQLSLPPEELQDRILQLLSLRLSGYAPEEISRQLSLPPEELQDRILQLQACWNRFAAESD